MRPPGKFDICVTRSSDQQDLLGFRIDDSQDIYIGTAAVDIDLAITVVSGEVNDERLLSYLDIFTMGDIVI